MAETECTYCVILPEGILGVTQQQFFGHKRAVQPDSTTETKSKASNYIKIIFFVSAHLFKLSSPQLQFSLQYWSFQPFHVV